MNVKKERTVHTSSLVVFIPGSAIIFPDCMLDPLLRMLIERIGNVLFRDPRLDVLALHLLD